MPPSKRHAIAPLEVVVFSCTCTETNRLPAPPQYFISRTETPEIGGSCLSVFHHCLSCTQGRRVARSNPSCLGMKTRLLLPQQLTCLSQGHTKRQTTVRTAPTPGDTLRFSISLIVRVCVCVWEEPSPARP